MRQAHTLMGMTEKLNARADLRVENMKKVSTKTLFVFGLRDTWQNFKTSWKTRKSRKRHMQIISSHKLPKIPRLEIFSS